MGKTLLLLSFLSVLILTIGAAIAPNSELFLLASSSNSYQIIREILASVLFLQLITHPPRHLFFRVLAGLVAATVAGWAIVSTYNGMMPFLDTFSMLASAAAIGVTALEIRPAEEKQRARNSSSNPLIA